MSDAMMGFSGRTRRRMHRSKYLISVEAQSQENRIPACAGMTKFGGGMLSMADDCR